MDNKLIAAKLRDLARLRQLQGASSFRSAAYSNAAEVVEGLDTEILDPEQLYVIDGIGEKIVAAVATIVQTGTHPELELNEAVLAQIRELTRVPGIGAKTAMKFVEDGINSLEALKSAILDGRVKRKKLLAAVLFAEIDSGGRIPIEFVLPVVDQIKSKLVPCCELVEAAGSIRRRRPTVKDIDILACTDYPELAATEFLKCGMTIEAGTKKASIFAFYRIADLDPKQIRVDLMIVPRKCWGAALCHFTGSKGHNIALREKAMQLGITVSQNGIIGPYGEWLGGENETDLYKVLGLKYVEPEDREV